jgi:hypothetical protein
VTDEVVRAQIRKAAVQKQTTVASAMVPRLGHQGGKRPDLVARSPAATGTGGVGASRPLGFRRAGRPIGAGSRAETT